jgi:hypothetical protein
MRRECKSDVQKTFKTQARSGLSAGTSDKAQQCTSARLPHTRFTSDQITDGCLQLALPRVLGSRPNCKNATSCAREIGQGLLNKSDLMTRAPAHYNSLTFAERERDLQAQMATQFALPFGWVSYNIFVANDLDDLSFRFR